ncbi:hypothetical protein SAMN04488543_3831 [Friedmanniella luteola]|uniref:Uncharacterized protein n=1 Tax=Friedmanniella luteola TaxID=546871 RepID=A0A1H1ZLL1_9ACTN|nr:hypothetical protein [Friedmanniella luteola]SDT34116.1 hypothetical protein SAMN04488543_3831 [Friedmanniella luteola]
MSDWEWFFTSEAGRTNLLRSQVDELAASSASANARSSRLSSQLTRLQGSLESRLNALAAAFDAYVELGDVREQLAAHADTAAVRRDVLAAVDALVGGRRAERVDPSDADDYWLPHAMNAVTALVAGGRDRAAEGRARTLGRQADLFVVVLLGALGHGALVADRVPDLLVTDGTLGDAQVVLWRALLAGVYGGPGDREAVLAAVGERWRSTLAGGDADEWRGWVAEQSGADDAEAELTWVRALLDGEVLLPLASPREPARRVAVPGQERAARAEPAAEGDPRAALRSVAGTLIAEGSEAERDLLTRARLLRLRVEDPSGLGPAGPVEPPPTEVRALVRQEFASTRDPAVRACLLGWLRPGLHQAVEAAVAAPPRPVEPVQQRTPGGPLVVGPDGPDADRLAQVRHTITARVPVGTLSPLVPTVLAGVFAVLALVGALLGWSAAVVGLVGVVAVVLAVVAVLGRRSRRQAAREQAADLAVVDQAVADAHRQLSDARAEQARQVQALRTLADGLRRDLTAAP